MIDLHLHLDGSLTAAEVCFLAQEQGIQMPADKPGSLRRYLTAPGDCRDLNTYLKCFDIPLQVLQTAESIHYAVSSLIYRLAKQRLLYAEIRFAPQLHTKKGLSQKAVVCAALDGLKKSKQHLATEIGIGMILCMMRGRDNDGENMETVRLAEKYLGDGVCAVDLAGAESLYPTKNYKSIFSMVQERRIPYTIHAGEADGPESIQTALSFGAKRIGHGVRSVEDDALLTQIVQEEIVLELCPSSNLQTKAVKDISEFPVKTFLSRGIAATINTDNMTVSDTTLEKEYQLLESGCGITAEEERQLLLNAANAAFLTPVKRRQLSWRVAKRLNMQAAQ